MTNQEYIPQEEPVATATARRGFTIGFPACNYHDEKRFPLTPEGGARLIERGFRVKIESGAAEPIHYTDMQYMRSGCDVVGRADTLQCDIVVHPTPLSMTDIKGLRKGAMLFTLFAPSLQEPECIKALMKKRTIAIALDLIEDDKGNRPFADILAEIDGRASLALASTLLADAEHGKGILLGGIAGINPCETVILGSDIAACSAAATAIGMGSIVRIFDNDLYRLRRAVRQLGPGVIATDMHPRVVTGALHSADIIIATPAIEPGWKLNSDEALMLKKGVLTFDLTSTDTESAPFPSMRRIPLADASMNSTRRPEGYRVCYINAGSAVPRTCAMALSNGLVTLLSGIYTCEGMNNALKLLPGLRKAAYLFLGHVVNEQIGARTGIRAFDINLYLTLS